MGIYILLHLQIFTIGLWRYVNTVISPVIYPDIPSHATYHVKTFDNTSKKYAQFTALDEY